jgi:polysaccharide biosynthesis protein PslJ
MFRTIRRIDWLQFLFVHHRWLATLSALALCVLVGMLGGWVVSTAGSLITAGLVVGIIGGLWILQDIEVGYWALIAVICLLPFGKLPFSIGFKPSFLDVVMGGLFGVWLVQSVLNTSPKTSSKQSSFLNTHLGLPILVFMLLAVVAFVAGLAHASLTQLIARHFAEVMLSISLFYIVISTVRQPEQLARLTRAIILAGFATAVLGIVLYLLPDGTSIDLLSALGRFDYPVGPGVLRYIRENPELPQRATSTSVDPNVLGGLLTMIGALATPQLFARRPLFSRRLLILFLGTIALCLLLTFSRGSFVATGSALVALAILRYRKLGLLMLVVLAIIWFSPLTQPYVTHFIEGLRGEDLATQMRFGEYRDAITLIQRYPVLGVGFAGSPDIDTYVSVANVYLLMAVEMGLLGLASFLIVITVLLIEAAGVWRHIPRHSVLEPIWYGLYAALLGALIGGIFDHYFFNLDFHHSVTLFWLFVGLAVAVSHMVKTALAPVPHRLK